MTPSTFTLRGQIDDPSATITVSGLTPEPIEGIVERNGLFWVENLPLTEGNNGLTLTATDAAGNAASQNLTIVRSTVNVALDPINEDTLTRATITVSGTINVNDHNVWVNGVQATLGSQNQAGLFTWSANNVPLNDGGTAIVQARAIPATDETTGPEPLGNGTMGNPAAQQAKTTEEQREKKPKYYVLTHWEYRHKDVYGDGQEYLREVTHTWPWEDGAPSTETEVSLHGPRLCDEVITTTTSWGADHYVLGPIASGLEASGAKHYVMTSACGSDENNSTIYNPYIPLERCGVIDVTPYGSYSRVAFTRIRLETGGKALVKKRNLFTFQANASEILSPRWLGPESTDPYNIPPRKEIPYKQIGIGRLGNLGVDGYLFKALPDNEKIDITPSASRKYYTFASSAESVG